MVSASSSDGLHAHDLNLEPRDQGSQCAQRRQHRIDDGGHATDEHGWCQWYLDQHLAVGVAYDQTADIALGDQALDAVDQFVARTSISSTQSR